MLPDPRGNTRKCKRSTHSHISGQGDNFRFTVGDHDLSDLSISDAGPIVETLDPGPNPLRRVWVPIYVEGPIDDPDAVLRIVHSGEATKVGLPGTE